MKTTIAIEIDDETGVITADYANPDEGRIKLIARTDELGTVVEATESEGLALEAEEWNDDVEALAEFLETLLS